MAVYQKRHAVVVITVMLILGADVGAEKSFSCCTEVSRQKITSPITGFRLQKENLPCVKAVIFETKGQQMCSHWNEPWVRKKVLELRKSFTSPPLPTSSTLTASTHPSSLSSTGQR